MSTDIDPLVAALAKEIKGLRSAEGLSQEDLGERAGLATGTVGRIERGVRTADVDQLLRIARVLDVKVSDLVARAETRACRSTTP